MRSVFVRAGLALSVATVLPGALDRGAAAGLSAAAPAQGAATGDAAKFAGTYALITIEEKDPATGDKDKSVTHHRVGQINPGGPVNVKRYYEFAMTPQGRERLTLTPQPAGGGGKEQATTRLIWERQQAAPLSAEQKQFVGFWKQLYTDRYRMKDGKMVFHGDADGKQGARVTTQAGTSYIIYTESGHMMVILMDNSGRKPHAGAQPTPDEALAAWGSIGGYFGRFITYENQNPQYVIHSQQGSNWPGTYSDQQRYYQFAGDVLRLGGPPTYNEKTGELEGGHLYWQKMKLGEK